MRLGLRANFVSSDTPIRIENEYANACKHSFYLMPGKIYGLAECMPETLSINSDALGGKGYLAMYECQ